MKKGMSWVASVALALAASGCALFDRVGAGEPEAAAHGDAEGGAPERRIARDFLHALAQLDGYSPDRAVVRFVDGTLAADPLIAELEALMRSEGYAVRVVPDARTPGAVAHQVTVDGASGASVHTLSVGEVQMRRSYARTPRGDWQPAGSLYVRGVDASGIRMDEPPRDADGGIAPVPSPRPAPAPAPGTSPDAGGRLAGNDAVTITPVPLPRTTRRAAPPVAATRRATAGGGDVSGAAPLAFDRVSGKPVYSGIVATTRAGAVSRNMMDLGDSNYAELLDDYGNVEELILMFPNDSLRLGDDNKAQIRKTLERFDPRRDVYSIIGCSLGPTRLENGNEALALGRANRVKEELLFAGVPRERILDEGCWAGESATRFPSRGVVLTLKRRTG